MNDPWTIAYARENDGHIMDTVTINESCSVKKAVNRCRIYLQVSTISDITTGDGKKIHPDYIKGTKHQKSLLKWPTKKKPPKSDWKEWRRCLGKLSIENSLRSPLEKWISPSNMEWEWVFSEGSLYHKGKTSKKHKRISETSRNRFHLTGADSTAPSVLTKATTIKGKRAIIGSWTGNAAKEIESFTLPPGLHHPKDHLESAIGRRTITDDGGRKTAEALRLRTLSIASDGSYIQ